MSSSLQVTKIHLSAPVVDDTQAATKSYVDTAKGQSDAYAVQVSNQVKSDIMGGIPSTDLDPIKELADYLRHLCLLNSLVLHPLSLVWLHKSPGKHLSNLLTSPPPLGLSLMV